MLKCGPGAPLSASWGKDGWGGIKLVNVHLGNSAKVMPAISATYLLFYRETGTHRLILDGGELMPRRTAAASALAARHLARKDARRHLIVGNGRVGFNIDAEEQDRLDLSLDAIEAMLSDKDLAGWDGFGVVVQAYGRRAAPVIEFLYDLAERLDRKIKVRPVKGAYWDTEIKLAQETGVSTFPVFTRKAPPIRLTPMCQGGCAD